MMARHRVASPVSVTYVPQRVYLRHGALCAITTNTKSLRARVASATPLPADCPISLVFTVPRVVNSGVAWRRRRVSGTVSFRVSLHIVGVAVTRSTGRPLIHGCGGAALTLTPVPCRPLAVPLRACGHRLRWRRTQTHQATKRIDGLPSMSEP